MSLAARAALTAGLTLAAVAPSLAAQGEPLRAIQLERQDIFSRAEAGRYLYARLANATHVTTIHRVIRREVLLEPGAAWDSALAEETERNLRGLGVFRAVEVDSVRTDSGLVAVVRTRDGWSTSLDASYRRTDGDVDWGVSLVERNLLGTVTRAGLGYRSTPDRTILGAEFSQPRLVAGHIGLGVAYQDRSDGWTASAAVTRPFYSLASRSAWSVLGDYRDETIYQYFEGEPAARDTVARRFALGRVDAAIAHRAGSWGYTRVGAFAQIRRDDYAPFGFPAEFGRTITGAVGAAVEWRSARYVVARGLAGTGQQEDVDLSHVARIGLAVTPSAFGYDRDGIVPSAAARAGVRRGPAVGWAEFTANGRFTSAGLDSGRVRVALTGFAELSRHRSVVLHAEAGWIESPAPGSEFDLGFGTGPRSFGAHAFTGDRAVYATAEYRWYPIRDLAGLVSLGLAGFADWGGAWYDGAGTRTGWDAGFGLRIGASRSSDPRALRFDLGHRSASGEEPAGWVLSVGTGLTFNTRVF